MESPLVCDILSSADEYGLMKMSSKSDFSTTTPSTIKEEKEFIKFTLEDAIVPDKKMEVDDENEDE